METHEFTVIVPELTDDTIDAIAAKCPDSGVGTRAGKTYVDFDRQAASLGAAVDSAINDLAQLGVQPIRVSIEVPQTAGASR